MIGFGAESLGLCHLRSPYMGGFLSRGGIGKSKENAKKKNKEKEQKVETNSNTQILSSSGAASNVKKENQVSIFTFRELADATQNFQEKCLLGEGGFGRVYKGYLESRNQIVATKQLNLDGVQGSQEFLVELLMLCLHHHPNLVNLIGYCVEGDQRLLVYEYMPFGSVEEHLHGSLDARKRLDWNIRMKIVAGTARGLKYLHNNAHHPVIYRDLKTSNVLLDEEYHPKLSDFGLAKLAPTGDNTHVSTRVMGTYGYCAPEYAMTGKLTTRSDIYSFGVFLLEIITGRKAIDETKPAGQQNLITWARPLLKQKRMFPCMIDPVLKGKYPPKGLYQVLSVAALCVQEKPHTRPVITDMVSLLDHLASQKYDPEVQPARTSPSPSSISRSIVESSTSGSRVESSTSGNVVGVKS